MQGAALYKPAVTCCCQGAHSVYSTLCSGVKVVLCVLDLRDKLVLTQQAQGRYMEVVCMVPLPGCKA